MPKVTKLTSKKTATKKSEPEKDRDVDLKQDERKQEEIEQTQPVAQITMGDLKTVVDLIDLVTKRGAFNGDELELVGRLRNHIATYINQETQRVVGNG